jgi:hypothetical protein
MWVPRRLTALWAYTACYLLYQCQTNGILVPGNPVAILPVRRLHKDLDTVQDNVYKRVHSYNFIKETEINETRTSSAHARVSSQKLNQGSR